MLFLFIIMSTFRLTVFYLSAACRLLAAVCLTKNIEYNFIAAITSLELGN